MSPLRRSRPRRAAVLLAGGVGLAAALLVAAAPDPGPRAPVPPLVTQDPARPAVTLAGHRLHLLEVAGPPGAPVLVVLHGGPGGDFRALRGLAQLSDRFRVVFYDQRGAGLSQRVPEAALDLDGYLAELNAVIDHALRDTPGARVSLLGQSWGAMLATAYLARAPQRVDRAVLIEPGYLDAAGRSAWRAAARRFRSGPRWWAAGLRAGWRAARLPAPRDDPDARDDALVGAMVQVFADHPGNPYHCGGGYAAPAWRFGARASAAWEAAPDAEVDRIAAGAARFRGPVLLVAGACNSWTGAPLQARHRRLFHDARLAVIPGAGHAVLTDAPAPSLARIRAFLAP